MPTYAWFQHERIHFSRPTFVDILLDSNLATNFSTTKALVHVSFLSTLPFLAAVDSSTPLSSFDSWVRLPLGMGRHPLRPISPMAMQDPVHRSGLLLSRKEAARSNNWQKVNQYYQKYCIMLQIFCPDFKMTFLFMGDGCKLKNQKLSSFNQICSVVWI